MPEKEGLETIVDLRREFPHVKIIAMSAGSERAKINLLDLARRLGAQHTITKPFDLLAITDLVAKLLKNGGKTIPDEEGGDALFSDQT
jgi:DNA-binding response OmpR family regulator